MKRSLLGLLMILALAGVGTAAWVLGTPSGKSWRLARLSTSDLMARGLETPSDPALQEILAARLLAENHPAEAAAAFGAASAAEPGHTEFVLQQCRALLQAGSAKEALALVEGRLKEQPRDPFLNAAAGEVDLAQGNYLNAAPHFRAALGAPAIEPDARAGLSFALAEAHEHTAALEEAKAAARLQPDSGRAKAALGHALLLSGDVRAALPSLQRAVELAPRDAAAWELLCRASVENAQSTGDFGAAEKVISQARTAAPQSAVVAYYAGLLYTAQRRFDDAVSAFNRALQLNPIYADALYNLSIAQSFAGRKEASAETRRRFTEISEYSRAATDLQLRVQRDPGRRDLWERLLRLAESHGDTARAAYCRYRLEVAK